MGGTERDLHASRLLAPAALLLLLLPLLLLPLLLLPLLRSTTAE
jgi:hypothetical protein